VTGLLAALASLLAFLVRMASSLAIEDKTSKSTNATTALLLTRMFRQTGTQLGDSIVTDIIIEATGNHVELCL